MPHATVDIDRQRRGLAVRARMHKTSTTAASGSSSSVPRPKPSYSATWPATPQTYCFQPIDSERKRRAEQHAERKTPLSCGTKPGDRRKRKPKRKPGVQYATDVYRRAITRACEAAGIPRWSPNQLRHTAGTEIRRQFGVEASRVTLGHSKISTTEIYSERDYGLAIQVARQVG